MSLNVSQQNLEQISVYKKLKTYPGYKKIVDELNNIIEEAEKTIFAIGADHKREYTARDIAIVKRDNAMRLKGLPDRMIAALSGTGEQTVDNPDAFSDPEEDIDEDMFADDLNGY